MKQALYDMVLNMTAAEMYQAMFVDTVTGVLNRTAFDKCAPYEAIAIVDLDSLKYINDTISHREGDKYLRHLADKLAVHFGPDNVYRLSGDEFVVTGTNQHEMDVALNNLQVIYHVFSYGVAKDLVDADTNLNYNKAVREKSGARASRGEQPCWFGKIAI